MGRISLPGVPGRPKIGKTTVQKESKMEKKVIFRVQGKYTNTLPEKKKELVSEEASPPPTAIPQEVLESVRSLRGTIEEATQSYVRSIPFMTGSYGGREVAFDIKDILLLGAITHSDVLLIGRTGSGKTKLANMTMEALFGKEGYYSKTTLPSMSPADFMDIDFPAIRKGDKKLKEAISALPSALAATHSGTFTRPPEISLGGPVSEGSPNLGEVRQGGKPLQAGTEPVNPPRRKGGPMAGQPEAVGTEEKGELGRRLVLLLKACLPLYLQRFVEDLAGRYQWKVETTVEPTPHLVEGQISAEDWLITIKLHPRAAATLAREIGADEATAGGLMGQVVYTVLRHEMGHWEHCPYDDQWRRAILEGICEGLMGKVLPRAHEDRIVGRLANMFADIVVNTSLVCWDEGRSDFVQGWTLLSLKELLKSGEPDEEYQIFIGAQAAIFLAGEEGRWAEELRGLIGKFSPSAKGAMEECVKIFLDPLLPGASELGEIAASLNRRELWQRKAKRFAEVLSRFVKDREARCSYGGDSFSTVLDDLYRARAERLVLEFRAYEESQEEGYPVAHLQTRRLSEKEGIPLSKIRWSATRFVPNRQDGRRDVALPQRESRAGSSSVLEGQRDSSRSCLHHRQLREHGLGAILR